MDDIKVAFVGHVAEGLTVFFPHGVTVGMCYAESAKKIIERLGYKIKHTVRMQDPEMGFCDTFYLDV